MSIEKFLLINLFYILDTDAMCDENEKTEPQSGKPKQQRKRKVSTKEDPSGGNALEEVDEKKSKRATKRKNTKSETVAESSSSSEIATENAVVVVVEKKSKKGTKQTKATVEEPTEETPNTEINAVAIPSSRRGRGRKNSQAQTIPTAVNEPIEEATVIDTTEIVTEKKPKRGRQRKVADEKVPSVETVEAAPKTRRLRVRTVSTRSEGTEKEEPPKTMAKRTRRAAVETEVEEEPPAPKRTRNTKKTKEVEAASSSKETVVEKPAKRAKKAIESTDAGSVKTPPISTRTRRHK